MAGEEPEAIREYLKKLGILKNRVQASVESPSTPCFRVKYKNKTVAYVNSADYDWMRFRGKLTKSIPYNGMIVKLEPDTVIGVSKVVDATGNYKVIIPCYKKTPVSMEQNIVGLIKARCFPYTGKIESLFLKKKVK